MSKSFVEGEISAIKSKLNLFELNRINDTGKSHYNEITDEDSKLLFWKTYLKLKNRHFRTIIIAGIVFMILIVINKFNFGNDSFYQCVLCIGIPLYVLLSLFLPWLAAWALWWPACIANKIIELHKLVQEKNQPKSLVYTDLFSFLHRIGIKINHEKALVVIINNLISLGSKFRISLKICDEKHNRKKILRADFKLKNDAVPNESQETRKIFLIYALDCCIIVISIDSKEIKDITELFSQLKATEIKDEKLRETILEKAK